MKPARTEIVVIVDRDDRVINQVPRQAMRAGNLIHRAAYVLVFNQKDQLFLQKRTATKDIYPGFWDIAAGGVVLAGESYRAAAVRELAEELGLEHVDITWHFNHYYEDQGSRVWGAVFTCLHDGPFTLQAEEIEAGFFFDLQAVHALSEKEPFTPDGLEILQKFIDLQNEGGG